MNFVMRGNYIIGMREERMEMGLEQTAYPPSGKPNKIATFKALFVKSKLAFMNFHQFSVVRNKSFLTLTLI